MAGRTSAVEPEDVERVYDDDGGLAGLSRDEALTAVAALTGALTGLAVEVGASTGLLAGLAAAGGAGAWTGFLAAEPEDEGRLLDGDMGFFSAVEAGFGREEEEARAGKLASVFSKGLDAVAVEEEEVADQALTVSEGAAPATTTGAVPGCWTIKSLRVFPAGSSFSRASQSSFGTAPGHLEKDGGISTPGSLTAGLSGLTGPLGGDPGGGGRGRPSRSASSRRKGAPPLPAV